MGITWRDAMNTVLAALVALIGLAVVNEWGWPLLGSIRAGTLAVGVVGWGMCIFSGIPEQTQKGAMREPANMVLAVLGVTALGLIVAVLIVGSEGLFMALVVLTLAMWLGTTIRHAFTGAHAPGAMSHPAG
jgi:hypothetical protein